MVVWLFATAIVLLAWFESGIVLLVLVVYDGEGWGMAIW